MKNLKFLSLGLLLAGFTVSATRGALTDDKNIEATVDQQTGALQNETAKLDDSKLDELKLETDESKSQDLKNTQTGMPKSELVFDETKNKKDLLKAQPAAPVEIADENLQKPEIKSDIDESVVDETQKTFAEKAEEKAQEKSATIDTKIKDEVTEEEMVFNPEKKDKEIILDEKLEEKIIQEKKPSAAKEILAEEAEKEEKDLEDQGNNSYSEEDAAYKTPEGQEIEIDTEDSRHLVG